MKTLKLNYTFLLFFINTCLFAQQFPLSGKVLNNEKQAVEFANILLKSKVNPALQYGTISAADGAFKIDLIEKGDYELKITFIGYTDWQQEISISDSLKLDQIILEPMTNELGEVVVTATQKVIERKEDKLIFNVQRSPLKSGFDGMEVLQRSPNVWVDQNGAILMRNEAVTVLINGRISNLSGDNLANYISNLRSEDIKAIEIQSHLSANTDAESSGGVINIVLRRKPVGFDANIRTVYTKKSKGDYRNYNAVSFNYGAQKWNVYGAYNYQQETGLFENHSSIDYFITQNRLQEKGAFERFQKRHNYQLGFVADAIQNHVFGIECFATNFNRQNENLSRVSIFNNNDTLDTGSANLIGDGDNDLYNVTFNYTWTIDTLYSKLKFFADFSNSKVNQFNTVTSSYDQDFYTGISERNNSTAGTDIYGLQMDLEKYFQNGLKLEAGSKFSNTQRENVLLSDFLINEEWIANERSRSFDYDEQVIGVYTSLSKKINNNYFLKIGLRGEATALERVDISQDTVFRQDYTDWFPSIYFARDFSDDLSVSLSFSKRLRRPSFQLLNNYVVKVNDFRFDLGNPELRPEYVHNYELSFKHKKQTIDLYYQKTTEAVNGIYFLEGEISFYKKFNSGSQTQTGFSYNRSGRLNSWWNLNVSTGVYNRKFTEESGEDQFQRTTGYFRINNIFKINKTTSLEVSASYRSKHEDAYYLALPIYNANLMVQKSFFKKKLSARIYFRDIFNTMIFVNERPFDDFISKYSTKPQTRTIRLWLSYNFSGKNKINKRKNNSKNEARGRL